MKPARDRVRYIPDKHAWAHSSRPGPAGISWGASPPTSSKVSVVDLKDKPQGQSLDESGSVPGVEWSDTSGKKKSEVKWGRKAEMS